jgi:hypothetical protein
MLRSSQRYTLIYLLLIVVNTLAWSPAPAIDEIVDPRSGDLQEAGRLTKRMNRPKTASSAVQESQFTRPSNQSTVSSSSSRKPVSNVRSYAYSSLWDMAQRLAMQGRTSFAQGGVTVDKSPGQEAEYIVKVKGTEEVAKIDMGATMVSRDMPGLPPQKMAEAERVYLKLKDKFSRSRLKYERPAGVDERRKQHNAASLASHYRRLPIRMQPTKRPREGEEGLVTSSSGLSSKGPAIELDGVADTPGHKRPKLVDSRAEDMSSKQHQGNAQTISSGTHIARSITGNLMETQKGKKGLHDSAYIKGKEKEGASSPMKEAEARKAIHRNLDLNLPSQA